MDADVVDNERGAKRQGKSVSLRGTRNGETGWWSDARERGLSGFSEAKLPRTTVTRSDEALKGRTECRAGGCQVMELEIFSSGWGHAALHHRVISGRQGARVQLLVLVYRAWTDLAQACESMNALCGNVLC